MSAHSMPSVQQTPVSLPRPVFGTETFSHKRKTPNTDTPVVPPAPQKFMTPYSRVYGTPSFATPGPKPLEEAESPSFFKSPYYDQNKREPYLKQAFVIVSRLGKGSFGEAFKVQSKEDGQHYAVKCSGKRFTSNSDRRRQIDEANYIRSLGAHPNCLRYYGAWEEDCVLYIQTELCERGSLQRYLDEIQYVPEPQIWHFVADLAQGLQHIHSHYLVHLDIKPANIFLTESGSLKIGDFGIAMDLQKREQDHQEGDPKYLAPELLNGQFDCPADIFSTGIMMLEIADNYELPNNGPVWTQLRSGWLPDIPHRSPALLSLICAMMAPDPARRPTAEALVNSPAMASIINQRVAEQAHQQTQQMDIETVPSPTHLYYNHLHVEEESPVLMHGDATSEQHLSFRPPMARTQALALDLEQLDISKQAAAEDLPGPIRGFETPGPKNLMMEFNEVAREDDD
eukprot:comp22488_c0_seq1/m.33924 comp22488_c0_seq1/g.33924  ORF comp22488_c0_seq1/g.33924 comp22488_c0_seq1/m.33924 type:complete len:455 (-) comp22488_c0_seq1:505-1869(-)